MRTKLLALAVFIAALVIATGAIALWSSTQTGTANTRVGSVGQFTFTAGPPPGAPGGPSPLTMINGPGGSGSASISVTTGSNVPMKLVSYAGVATPVVVSNAPGCDPSNFTPNATVQTLATPVVLPANSTTVVELPNVISMIATAPVACANANVTMTVSATVTQGS